MIWHPKPGQWVRIHYKKSVAVKNPYHGRSGIVRQVGGRRGPCNVGVDLFPVATLREGNEPATYIVVPRGNLMAIGL